MATQAPDFYADVPKGVRAGVKRHCEQKALYGWKTPFLGTYRSLCEDLFKRPAPSALWNNLIKCDWDQGRTDSRRALGHFSELRPLSGRLFRFEVELLQPGVIVFGTGPSYDNALKDSLAGLIQDSFIHETWGLWSFKAGRALCSRLRHPGALPSRRFRPLAEYYARVQQCIDALWHAPGSAAGWPPDASARVHALPGAATS